MANKTLLLVCPNCRRSYLGSPPFSDCPYCGFDYRTTNEGVRWDLLFFLAVILAFLVFVLISATYRAGLNVPQRPPAETERPAGGRT